MRSVGLNGFIAQLGNSLPRDRKVPGSNLGGYFFLNANKDGLCQTNVTGGNTQEGDGNSLVPSHDIFAAISSSTGRMGWWVGGRGLVRTGGVEITRGTAGSLWKRGGELSEGVGGRVAFGRGGRGAFGKCLGGVDGWCVWREGWGAFGPPLPQQNFLPRSSREAGANC